MKYLLTLITFVISLAANTLNPPPFPDYGLIVPSERTNLVDIQPQSNRMEIKKGWKMYGYDNGVYDVNKTFASLRDIVKIVWHYNNKDNTWYAYSPELAIQNSIKQLSSVKSLVSISPFEGFWVYGIEDMNITLNPDYSIPDKLVVISSQTPQAVSTSGGSFEISVSPLDDHQNLISDNLSKHNFYFRDIEIYDENNTKRSDANMSVTQVVVSKTSGASASLNNLILDLDSSGSMSSNDPNRQRVDAAKSIVSLVNSNSRVAILDFGAGSDNSLSNSRLLQNFTNDKTLLTNAIDKVSDSGGTPLYESLLDAISLLKDSYGTKTIIVFTDGEADNDDYFNDVITQANANGISIYTIGLGSGINADDLQEIAQKTGGLYAYASDADQLASVFNAVGTGTLKGRVIVKGLGVFSQNLPNGTYMLKGKIGFSIAGVTFLENIAVNIVIE